MKAGVVCWTTIFSLDSIRMATQTTPVPDYRHPRKKSLQSSLVRKQKILSYHVTRESIFAMAPPPVGHLPGCVLMVADASTFIYIGQLAQPLFYSATACKHLRLSEPPIQLSPPDWPGVDILQGSGLLSRISEPPDMCDSSLYWLCN